MTNVPDVQWSADVGQASWITERLAPFGADVITSVIPAGFEAYARILHPIDPDLTGEAVVRWADVAAWSGVEMTPGVQFHDIAIPEHDPVGPPPGQGSGPDRGTLNGHDAAALVDILRKFSNPDSCWFALWEGHGWESRAMLNFHAEGEQNKAPAAPATVPDPIPSAVRTGPRVELPSRSYLLYSGDVSAALAWVESEQQTPNLWWAADRSWCVASEIDLWWTYVGGSASLIERILADERLETQPVELRRRVRETLTAQVCDDLATA